MTLIRPISDLRNNFNAISQACHDDKETVFITKNGAGHLVVMSITRYEQLMTKLELYEKLIVAETEAKNGVKKSSHATVMERLREKYNADSTED